MAADHTRPLDPFWVVRRVRDDNKVMNSRPFHQHCSEESANAEAERLSQQHPGVRFMVMALTSSYYVPADAVAETLQEL